jgi:hypothetical protein
MTSVLKQIDYTSFIFKYFSTELLPLFFKKIEVSASSFKIN